jgi:hypothetical protein
MPYGMGQHACCVGVFSCREFVKSSDPLIAWGDANSDLS